MAYNYLESIKADIKSAFECGDYSTEDGFDPIYESIWYDISITSSMSSGDASLIGERVGANWALLVKACDEFCIDIPKNVRVADATIRHYLLHRALSEVFEEVCNDEQ